MIRIFFCVGKYKNFFRKSETIITYTWDDLCEIRISPKFQKQFLHVTSRFLKSQSKRIICTTFQNLREPLIRWDKKIPTIWKEYISHSSKWQFYSRNLFKLGYHHGLSVSSDSRLWTCWNWAWIKTEVSINWGSSVWNL